MGFKLLKPIFIITNKMKNDLLPAALRSTRLYNGKVYTRKDLLDYLILEEGFVIKTNVPRAKGKTAYKLENLQGQKQVFAAKAELQYIDRLLSQVDKGASIEMEHKGTIEKIKKPGIKTKDAAKMIAADHIAEKMDYYDKLEHAKLEKGGEVKDYVDILYEKAIAYLDTKKDFFYTKGSDSKTNFGHSRYINVFKHGDENYDSKKIRISDHSVENINRLMDEYHIRKEDDIEKKIDLIEYYFFPERFAKTQKEEDHFVFMEIPAEQKRNTDIVISERLSSPKRGAGRLIYSIKRNNPIKSTVIINKSRNNAEIGSYRNFEKGGPIQDLSEGTTLEGSSHEKGGIEIQVNNKQVAEAEGGEIVVNATNSKLFCEEISEINQRNGNGKALDCDKPCDDCDHSQHMAKGGSIPNNYKDKTAEQIWNSWSENQKAHFISDHAALKPFFKEENNIINKKWNQLPDNVEGVYVKGVINSHVTTGQYANGGKLPYQEIPETEALTHVVNKHFYPIAATITEMPIGFKGYNNERVFKVKFIGDIKAEELFTYFETFMKHWYKTANGVELIDMDYLDFSYSGADDVWYLIIPKKIDLRHFLQNFYKVKPIDNSDLFKDGGEIKKNMKTESSQLIGKTVRLKNAPEMIGIIGYEESPGYFYIKFKDGSDGIFNESDFEPMDIYKKLAIGGQIQPILNQPSDKYYLLMDYFVNNRIDFTKLPIEIHEQLDELLDLTKSYVDKDSYQEILPEGKKVDIVIDKLSEYPHKIIRALWDQIEYKKTVYDNLIEPGMQLYDTIINKYPTAIISEYEKAANYNLFDDFADMSDKTDFRNMTWNEFKQKNIDSDIKTKVAYIVWNNADNYSSEERAKAHIIDVELKEQYGTIIKGAINELYYDKKITECVLSYAKVREIIISANTEVPKHYKLLSETSCASRKAKAKNSNKSKIDTFNAKVAEEKAAAQKEKADAETKKQELKALKQKTKQSVKAVRSETETTQAKAKKIKIAKATALALRLKIEILKLKK